MNASSRAKPYQGPALLSCGFRPFFLLGSGWAALSVALWLPLFEGEIALPTLFAPRDWHVHEMLFGYIAAVLTGFLLTAIPNWTGRLPLQGFSLLFLVIVWVAGRIAIWCSVYVGGLVGAIVDCSFLAVLVAAVAREIIAGKNWRSLKVLIPVSILALANVGFHAEANIRGSSAYALRTSVAAILILIMLIGGRIVPSFTRNWLARENPGRLPVPFGSFDMAALTFSAGALCLWVVMPDGALTGAALCGASLLQLVRLARWTGERTTREWLVLVLHIAYAFVPLGFLLAGLAAFGLVLPSAGVHAWMAGAAGTMTLAVMTRASLGHTGQALVAGAGTQLIYAAVVIGAVARVGGALVPEWGLVLVHVAALAWIAAFGGFALLYAPLLIRTGLGRE